MILPSHHTVLLSVYETAFVKLLVELRRRFFNKESMPITVAIVAQNKQILAEDKVNPTTRTSLTKIIERLPRHDGKVSYQVQSDVYHCLTENELVYICISDPETKVRTAYGFLDDIKNKFKEQFGGSGYPRKDLSPQSCRKFAVTLASQMRYFNENPDGDKIGKLKSQIEDVKQVMLNNIDELIDRGERIDMLVDKTDQLQNQAGAFHSNSRTLRREMQWRNIKICIAIFLALCILGLVIAFIACGIDFKKCKSDEPPAAPGGTPSPGQVPPPTSIPVTPVPSTAIPPTPVPTTPMPSTLTPSTPSPTTAEPATPAP